jgi:hypothetical protein
MNAAALKSAAAKTSLLISITEHTSLAQYIPHTYFRALTTPSELGRVTLDV